MNEQKTETAVTMYDRIENPMEAIKQMGEWISKSGLFGCDKIEQGMVLAMTSYAERRPVTDICRRYHIMDGKLSMKSEAMLAEFNQHGGHHFWEKSDNKDAVIVLTIGRFKDFKVSYTIQDAERAGLCGKDGTMRSNQNKPGGWQKNPDAMLRARAVSKGIRMVDPSVVVGIYTPEEISDMRIETAQSVPTKSLLGSAPPSVSAPIVEISNVKNTDAPEPAAKKNTNQPVTKKKPAEEDMPLAIKLAEALEGMTGSANEWLIEKDWIKNQQTFRNLPAEKMQEILDRLPNFKVAVRTWKTQKEKEKKNDNS